MSTQVQRRRGTTAQHATFTGALGETTYDTDLQRPVTHDGATPGGFPAAMLHVANVFTQPQTISLPVGSPTAAALDLITDSVSRVTFRQDGYGTLHRQEADLILSGFDITKRGTTGDALGALSSGSGVGGFNFRGWDGAALSGTTASLRVFTTEAWTALAHGTRMDFLTTPIGSLTATQSATLSSTAFEVMSRLLLPNTTSATVGGIYFGGSLAFHNFGTNNIFAGVGSGNLTMTGVNNSFFGVTAGVSNTTGNSNSFFGRYAGRFNTTGTYNSFFGRSAGTANTTGGNNSFFGSSTGQANTTGVNNAFFGRSAGAANTTGGFNSFFGRSAGAANTTASSNSFFGYNSGVANTTGASNSFFGASAGAANTTAAGNSFFGMNAGLSNTTGYANSFFGQNTGRSTTTGNQNSFFGAGAGYTNSTGTNNNFFGVNAGRLNTTGIANSFFGHQTGQANTTASYNTFFGYRAGMVNTTGARNSFFGMSAGGANTTGANNILFGFQAGDNITTGSNNLVLGYNIDAPVATTSNQLSIGNLIFGTGIDGTGVAISSGNIGIAVITPHSGLHLGRSFATPYRATAVTTTFLASDYTIDATGTFTVNLPTAVGITGRIYVVKNSGVGTITLDPAGAELIDGLATATIVSGASITAQSTGTGWIII